MLGIKQATWDTVQTQYMLGIHISIVIKGKNEGTELNNLQAPQIQFLLDSTRLRSHLFLLSSSKIADLKAHGMRPLWSKAIQKGGASTRFFSKLRDHTFASVERKKLN